MREALRIDRTAFGDDHPTVAIDLNNPAQLLNKTNRISEAEPLMNEAITIFSAFQRRNGHPYPDTSRFLHNYQALLEEMGLPEEEIVRRMKEAKN